MGSGTASAASLSRSWSRGDDEHGLIARYAAKIAESSGHDLTSSEAEVSDSNSGAHQLLAQLEAKNQEILREIARIRREQEIDEGARRNADAAVASGLGGSVLLMEELSVLRQRKGELEQQLTGLQDSRKHLMVQLESLMKMIKVSVLLRFLRDFHESHRRDLMDFNFVFINFCRISSFLPVRAHRPPLHQVAAKVRRQ